MAYMVFKLYKKWLDKTAYQATFYIVSIQFLDRFSKKLTKFSLAKFFEGFPEPVSHAI